MTPEVTVVVPTYRRPAQLQQALASVPAAVGRSHELLVVDDCPEGSGFAVALAAQARYLCKAGIDRGLSASRNLGLDLARGQWLVFLDDDDRLVEGGIDRLLRQASADTTLVFGDYAKRVGEQLTPVNLAPVSTDHLLVCNQIPVGAYALRRAALLRRFDPRLRSHEDWEFLLAHAQAGRLQHVAGLVAEIDKTDNQAGSMQARRRQHFWLDFLSIYARFPAEHLAPLRAQMLQSLGIAVPGDMLRYGDVI